jgi:hypothetical protein
MPPPEAAVHSSRTEDSKTRSLFVTEIAPPEEGPDDESEENLKKDEWRTRTCAEADVRRASEPGISLRRIISTDVISGKGEARSRRGEACTVLWRSGRSKMVGKRTPEARRLLIQDVSLFEALFGVEKMTPVQF